MVSREVVLTEVSEERDRQEIGEFGPAIKRGYSLHKWNSVVGEERGEAEKEINHVDEVPTEREKLVHLRRLRTELVQTAASAVAFIESLDANELEPNRVKEIEAFGSPIRRCDRCKQAVPCHACAI